eukprot:8681423-Alexandrium_andersonii.AAC.1
MDTRAALAQQHAQAQTCTPCIRTHMSHACGFARQAAHVPCPPRAHAFDQTLWLGTPQNAYMQ